MALASIMPSASSIFTHITRDRLMALLWGEGSKTTWRSELNMNMNMMSISFYRTE